MSKAKIAVLVIIAAVAWFLVEQYVFGEPLTRTQRLMVLETTYATNNRDYFGGKLTQDVSITMVPGLKNDRGQDLYGSTTCFKTEQGMHCDIRLDTVYNFGIETAILTLNHEMCHVSLQGKSLPDSHGAEFQSCMQEGAAMGEFKDVW